MWGEKAWISFRSWSSLEEMPFMLRCRILRIDGALLSITIVRRRA